MHYVWVFLCREIDECFSDDKIEDILKIVSSEIPPSSPPLMMKTLLI